LLITVDKRYLNNIYFFNLIAMTTKSQKPDDIRKNMMAFLRGQIAVLLPKTFDKTRFVALVDQYLKDNSYLFECDKKTLEKSILNAAAMGLEIGSPLNHASLMSFKSRKGAPIVQLIIEYRGYIVLCYRSGKTLALSARAVYIKDEFDFQYGSDKYLHHRPAPGDRGELVAAYAIAYLKGNQIDFEVIDRQAAQKARRDSFGANHPKSLWNKREPEMWVKTAIRRLSNRLPQCAEDIVFEPSINIDASKQYIDYQKAVKSSPELNSQALAILQLESPRTPTEFRLVTNLMRYLYKQASTSN
jgi:recombination protein RecT